MTGEGMPGVPGVRVGSSERVTRDGDIEPYVWAAAGDQVVTYDLRMTRPEFTRREGGHVRVVDAASLSPELRQELIAAAVREIRCRIADDRR